MLGNERLTGFNKSEIRNCDASKPGPRKQYFQMNTILVECDMYKIYM